jgi:hypothetical protein
MDHDAMNQLHLLPENNYVTILSAYHIAMNQVPLLSENKQMHHG